eukprot:Lithocolla_globosa_v1_NODE_36_length_8467_cov_5.306110.p2 type:complete len:117 gc:universal NODE_36_length_8467_cov_5.306110:575-925(+)
MYSSSVMTQFALGWMLGFIVQQIPIMVGICLTQKLDLASGSSSTIFLPCCCSSVNGILIGIFETSLREDKSPSPFTWTNKAPQKEKTRSAAWGTLLIMALIDDNKEEGKTAKSSRT